MNKTLKKSLIIVGCVLGGIILLYLILHSVLTVIGYFMYRECRNAREYACDIPALGTGFAPQGITYSADLEMYIHTGYMPDNRSSLFFTDAEGYRERMLLDEDGNTLKGHAGGVTVTGNCVYIASGASLYMYDLIELYYSGDDEGVMPLNVYCVDNNAAYCFGNDEYLFVGEFYRASNYKTDESHWYATPSGDDNRAIVSCYKLDAIGFLETGEGESMPYPEYCISITGLVQGFATDGETYMLSRSYGLTNSKLEYHSAPVDSGRTIDVKFKNAPDAPRKSVPLYYMDSGTLYKTLTLPAFGEDITIKDGRVVVTNEASANKYFVGKLFGANKAYSFPIYKKDRL